MTLCCFSLLLFDKIYRCRYFRNTIVKQECIPVGCVPAAHWPYAGVCFPGGVSALGGVCLVRGGVCLFGGVSAPRGCVPGVGGFMLLGGCAWSGGCLVWGSAPEGVCLVWGGLLWGGVPGQGGCLLWGGFGIPACTEADTLPPCLWTESQTPVKTLPWPNFVAAGNNNFVSFGSFYFNPGQNMRQVVN